MELASTGVARRYRYLPYRPPTIPYPARSAANCRVHFEDRGDRIVSH